MEALVLVYSLIALCVGLVLIRSANGKSKRSIILGALATTMSGVSILYWGSTLLNTSARSRDTFTFIGTAINVSVVWTDDHECIQPFTLKQYSDIPLDYVFQVKCNGPDHLLQSGDVVRVKFVDLHTQDKTVEVLEFLDLSQEVKARLDQYHSSQPEAQPAN